MCDNVRSRDVNAPGPRLAAVLGFGPASLMPMAAMFRSGAEPLRFTTPADSICNQHYHSVKPRLFTEVGMYCDQCSPRHRLPASARYYMAARLTRCAPGAWDGAGLRHQKQRAAATSAGQARGQRVRACWRRDPRRAGALAATTGTLDSAETGRTTAATRPAPCPAATQGQGTSEHGTSPQHSPTNSLRDWKNTTHCIGLAWRNACALDTGARGFMAPDHGTAPDYATSHGTHLGQRVSRRRESLERGKSDGLGRRG